MFIHHYLIVDTELIIVRQAVLLCLEEQVLVFFHLGRGQFVAPELNGGEAREVTKHLDNQLKVLLLNAVNVNFEFIIFEKFLN